MQQSPHQYYQHCKPLVSGKEWKAFEELLDHLIGLELGVLTHATDIGQVRETQGKIKAFRSVRALPEDIKRRDIDTRHR